MDQIDKTQWTRCGLTRREYYLLHREKICARERDKYRANPAKRLEDQRRRRIENPQHVREIVRKSYEKTKKPQTPSQRARHIKRRYGITLDQYEEMFAAQNGCCYICKIPEPQGRTRLNIDHHHGTKAVRKLLCIKCNQGIGLFNEDPQILERAAAYLREHASAP